MISQPKVSIVVPIHEMPNGDFFLWRLVNSLTEQTFKNWELIVTKDGRMAENTNAGIKRARGEYIKILYLDDYFSPAGQGYSLGNMVDKIEGDKSEWLISGTNNNPYPSWTDDIETGNNKLGSPSSLLFKNHFEDNLLFDESMSWLLDCDLYKRMYEKFGKPSFSNGDGIFIGEGSHQMTHIITDEQKLAEHEYMKQKYEGQITN